MNYTPVSSRPCNPADATRTGVRGQADPQVDDRSARRAGRSPRAARTTGAGPAQVAPVTATSRVDAERPQLSTTGDCVAPSSSSATGGSKRATVRCGVNARFSGAKSRASASSRPAASRSSRAARRPRARPTARGPGARPGTRRDPRRGSGTARCSAGDLATRVSVTRSTSRGQVDPEELQRHVLVLGRHPARPREPLADRLDRLGERAADVVGDVDRDEQPERLRPPDARRDREPSVTRASVRERRPSRCRRTRSSAACSEHRRTSSRSYGQRNPCWCAVPSASSPIQTCPGSAPPWRSGPAAPVSATARSAPNTRRAPAAISAAHSRLTGAGPLERGRRDAEERALGLGRVRHRRAEEVGGRAGHRGDPLAEAAARERLGARDRQARSASSRPITTSSASSPEP